MDLEKERRSMKEALDVEFRTRRLEVLNLDKDIRDKNNRLLIVKEDTVKAMKERNDAADKLKTANVKVNAAGMEAKSLKNEASSTLKVANQKFDEAKALVDQRKKDLAELDRDKEIVRNIKIQGQENISLEKKLVEKEKAVDEKMFEYSNLIGDQIQKNREIDEIKKDTEQYQVEAQRLADVNKAKSEEIDKLKVDLIENNKSADIQLKKHIAKQQEIEDSKNALDGKIAAMDSELAKLSTTKESQRKELEALEGQRRLLATKEKRVEAVVTRLKKEKQLEDDLNAAGIK